MLLRTPMRLGMLLGVAALGVATIANAHSALEKASKARSRAGARVEVTFAHDIAPLLYASCSKCHRDGQIGPFSLVTYQDARKHATQVALATEQRFMPPWHADSHGEFLDEHTLTDDQIALFKTWVANGSPEGPKAAEPPLPHFPEGWELGKPDMIVQSPKSYTLAADGTDVYRCFVLPSNTTEDRWVSAIEVKPGNTKIVHHVIAYLDASHKAMGLQYANKDGQPGYTAYGGIGVSPTGALGGWAPGNLPRLQPDGVGIFMPKGSDIVLQVHYHKSGKLETDQTKIGVFFCKKPVDQRLRIMPVINFSFRIPAGDSNYTAEGLPMPITENISVRGVMPHMHLLGREMTVTAKLPDASTKTLVHVPNWDFNWQTTYTYKTPLSLPAGSSFGLTARYDNSENNPRNPSNPPKEVGWGEQTTDEMCIAFVYYTVDREHITKGEVVTDWLDKLMSARGKKLRESLSAPKF